MHSENINNLLYYYFPEALSTLLFSGKISLDNICTEKIVSKSFKFIKKYALKLLLENNNNFFFLFTSAQRGPGRQKLAQPSSPRARRPHPGRNLGLGRQSATARLRPPRPATARGSVAVGSDRTAARRLRPDQNQRRAGA